MSEVHQVALLDRGEPLMVMGQKYYDELWRAIDSLKVENAHLREVARAEVERMKAELEQVREKNGSLADRIEKTDSELRDAWKAEERLKATLRLMWEEATDEERCDHDNGHGLSQPCREAVEAALKEED